MSSAPVVDCVSGVDDIARLWGDRFKELYNTADDSISSELLLSLDSSTTLADIEQISVSFQTVQEVIGKLKRGKSDGGPLVSDHIVEATVPICHFPARLFTSVLRHSFMPAALHDATIQPIPKGSKDPSVSSNYRVIALASSLSKVLEWSILFSWSQFFTTSDLQFGFKSGFSTTLCTGVLKAVINRYLCSDHRPNTMQLSREQLKTSYLKLPEHYNSNTKNHTSSSNNNTMPNNGLALLERAP